MGVGVGVGGVEVAFILMPFCMAMIFSSELSKKRFYYKLTELTPTSTTLFLFFKFLE